MTTKPSAAVDGHLAPAVDTSMDLPLSPVPPPLFPFAELERTVGYRLGLPSYSPCQGKGDRGGAGDGSPTPEVPEALGRGSWSS